MSADKKLEDFGEHIAGAKKETYTRFSTLDLNDKETQSLPFSKRWSQKEIDAIEDKNVAVIAHVLRQSTPNKPRVGYKLSRWLINLQQSQEVVKSLVDNPAQASKILVDMADNHKLGGQVYLLSKLDREKWGAVESLNNVRFWNSIDTGLTPETSKTAIELSVNGQKHRFEYNNTLSFKDAIDLKLDDINAYIDKAIIEKDESKGIPKGYSLKDFAVYRNRRSSNVFVAFDKDRQHTPLESFESVAQAREYIKKNLDELVSKWEAHKTAHNIKKEHMRGSENAERTGESYRDHNITPEEFMATFNVRGGQFGNWVTQEERTEMLNRTYDGLMDLARVMKVEPKSIGLDGNLGIAFGARGSGRANAHYEPSLQVINLTKTRGAGSLAHEWWHALDKHIGKHDYFTNDNTLNNAKTNEMLQSVNNLMQAINSSEYKARSQKADEFRNKAYFGTKVEMTARAFEAVVIHELKQQGIKNDFLANINSHEIWGKMGLSLEAYPYPKGQEITNLAEKYNHISDDLSKFDKDFPEKVFEQPESIRLFDANTSNKKLLDTETINTQNNQVNQPIDDSKIVPKLKEPDLTKNTAQSNININVPYREKNEAKELGAKWNVAQKSWYIPAGEDLDKFVKWSMERTQDKPSEKNYLYTIPADKDEVKALGAKWDKEHNLWYAPAGADQTKFSKFLTRPDVPSPEQAFANYLKEQRITIEAGHPKMDGKAYRLANDGSDAKNVLYQFYANHGGVPSARITNFSRNGEPEKWTYPIEYMQREQNIEAVGRAKYGADYKPKAKNIIIENNLAISKAEPENRLEIYNQTADRVKKLFDIAPVATSHAYLDRKGISSNNVAHIVPDAKDLPDNLKNDIVIINDWRQAKEIRENNPDKMVVQKDSLIIPQYSSNGELRSFETIGYNGAKYALKDGEKNGLLLKLGNIENGKPFIIAEGYATAATFHEQAKIPVVIAFGKGNLTPIAADLRKAFPDSKIYFAADNDHVNEREGKGNAGIEESTKVANKINGYVLIPKFDVSDNGKDWNDIFIDKGLSEFRKQLKQQLVNINSLEKDKLHVDLSHLDQSEKKLVQDFITVIEERFKSNPIKLNQTLEQVNSKVHNVDYKNLGLSEVSLSQKEPKELSR